MEVVVAIRTCRGVEYDGGTEAELHVVERMDRSSSTASKWYDVGSRLRRLECTYAVGCCRVQINGFSLWESELPRVKDRLDRSVGTTVAI